MLLFSDVAPTSVQLSDHWIVEKEKITISNPDRLQKILFILKMTAAVEVANFPDLLQSMNVKECNVVDIGQVEHWKLTRAATHHVHQLHARTLRHVPKVSESKGEAALSPHASAAMCNVRRFWQKYSTRNWCSWFRGQHKLEGKGLLKV